MSDADSFIREVSEEMRRDRMFRLWRRYGPFAIGGVIAVVAAAALIAWLDHRADAAAREAGGRLIEAASSEAPAERLLTAVADLDEGPAALARLQAAAATAAAGDAAEAVALYEEVAGASAVPQPVAEFAALRAALLRAETGDAGAAMAGYDALAREDSAYRPLALEARGVLKLSQGDLEGARADLQAAADDPAATQATRERAAAVIDALAAQEGAR